MFSLDLHASAAASVRGGLTRLGVALDQWMIGDPKHIARDRPHLPVADPVALVNRHTWVDLTDERIEAFWRRYSRPLREYDGFLVNHASALARLFLPSGKPILVHNTSRYENPYTLEPELWSSLDHELAAGVETGQLTVISNNQGDSDYLKFYSGIHSQVMPSVTDYATGRPAATGRPFALAGASPEVEELLLPAVGNSLQPLRRIFPCGYLFSDLQELRGVVVVPYQISTMFMFELMNARVPLFIPSDHLIHRWFQAYPGVLSQLSYFQVRGMDTRMRPVGDLNRICDEGIRQWWLDRADFSPRAMYPLVRRFDSPAQLKELLTIPPTSAEKEDARGWVAEIADRRITLLADFTRLL